MRHIGDDASGRLNAIGLASGSVGSGFRSNAYQSHIIDGIVSAVRSLSQDLVTFYGHSSDKIETSLPAYRSQCDGLLHFISELEDDAYEAIRAAGVPLVTIGGSPGDGDCSSVDVDNVTAARDVTRHLIDLGHHRIALLRGDEDGTSAKRVLGFRLAHEEASLPVHDEFILSGGGCTYLSGSERAEILMGLPRGERPSAIVGYNDVVALGALRAASSMGIRAPEELSVVGFDDIVEANLIRPPLTTVRQPLRLIGEKAVELLLAIIGGTKPHGTHVILPHELVIRGSTAPPSL